MAMLDNMWKREDYISHIHANKLAIPFSKMWQFPQFSRIMISLFWQCLTICGRGRRFHQPFSLPPEEMARKMSLSRDPHTDLRNSKKKYKNWKVKSKSESIKSKMEMEMKKWVFPGTHTLFSWIQKRKYNKWKVKSKNESKSKNWMKMAMNTTGGKSSWCFLFLWKYQFCVVVKWKTSACF